MVERSCHYNIKSVTRIKNLRKQFLRYPSPTIWTPRSQRLTLDYWELRMSNLAVLFRRAYRKYSTGRTEILNGFNKIDKNQSIIQKTLTRISPTKFNAAEGCQMYNIFRRTIFNYFAYFFGFPVFGCTSQLPPPKVVA